MMLGSKVTLSDWWLWNQIPMTLGNLVGGFLFTGLALYLTHKKKEKKAIQQVTHEQLSEAM